MRPFPRGAAVTSGVPSARHAQVLAAGSGRALDRDTVTSSGAASRRNGLFLSKGAMCLGVSHDSAPPSVRPPLLSAVGVRSSSPAARRVGEAHRHAAEFDEIDEFSCAGPVGEHEHRRLFHQQRQDPDRSTRRAIGGRAQQRRPARRWSCVGDSSGWATSALTPETIATRRRREAFSRRANRARRSFVGDDDPRNLIAQLEPLEDSHRPPASRRGRTALRR